MDEKAAQIIARVVEGKLLLWPQTLAAPPQPMGDQSFILSHAALVKVFAPAAESVVQMVTKSTCSIASSSACTSGLLSSEALYKLTIYTTWCGMLCVLQGLL